MKSTLPILILNILLLTGAGIKAQNNENSEFSPAIEDNSMFVEEAYNQEDRVVQHISNLVILPLSEKDFSYSFTQEWPAFGLKHQLSYTLQWHSFSNTGVSGFGDILLNYRYQLWYKQNFITCSPRISLIVPTGNHSKQLGDGSWGLQINLPVSKRWTNHFINHFNLGTSYLFKVSQAETGFDHSMLNYFGGLSSIWLLTEKTNLMLECMTYYNAKTADGNTVNYTNETIIAPGFRHAINIKSLQIVPGITIPFSFSKEDGKNIGLFFYLSLEHPY